MATGLQLKFYFLGDEFTDHRGLKHIISRIEKEKSMTVDLTMIDLNEMPDEAELAQILAIPTLIKEPSPRVRLVGKLVDVEQVISILCKGI